MKKNALKIVVVAIVALCSTACTKDAVINNNGITTGNSDNFVWTENDNTFATANIIKCDSAYASAQFKTIFVYKGPAVTKYYFEINLSSLAVASYSVNTANQVTYLRPGSLLLAGFGGAIDITANANNKITGTGVISLPFAASGSTTSRVYIKFTDLIVK